MGLLDEVEKLGGAVAAVEGLKKIDGGAGMLSEAAAAVAGFEGTGAIKEKLEEMKEQKENQG